MDGREPSLESFHLDLGFSELVTIKTEDLSDELPITVTMGTPEAGDGQENAGSTLALEAAAVDGLGCEGQRSLDGQGLEPLGGGEQPGGPAGLVDANAAGPVLAVQPLVQRKRRSRNIYTEVQVQELERFFLRVQYPDVIARAQLAERLNLPEAKVQVWFQNRRAKWRRHQRAQMLRNMAPFALAPHMGLYFNGPYNAVPVMEHPWRFFPMIPRPIGPVPVPPPYPRPPMPVAMPMPLPLPVPLPLPLPVPMPMPIPHGVPPMMPMLPRPPVMHVPPYGLPPMPWAPFFNGHLPGHTF